jgi:RNA recognition motif-containing protein
VYVGNLSWEASWQDLKDHMRGTAQDLEVAHVDVMTDSSGRSKGCAIVEYSNPEVRSELYSLNTKRLQ